MASKSYDDFINELNAFSRGIPKTTAMFVILFVLSVIIGIAAVTLMNYQAINSKLSYIVVNGVVTGILVIMMPTLLTIIIIKALKRYINSKYIFFLSMVGTFFYSLFILLGSIVYIFTNLYVIAAAIIIVG